MLVIPNYELSVHFQILCEVLVASAFGLIRCQSRLAVLPTTYYFEHLDDRIHFNQKPYSRV